MNTDKSNDKYEEIFNELKEDKMEWKFEDFLAQTEKQDKIIPFNLKAKGSPIPNIFWMAASVVLLVSVGFYFKFYEHPTIGEQDVLVKNEILKQKDSFSNDGEIVAMHTSDSVNVVSDSLVSDSISLNSDEEVMDKILPKRGRIKRQTRPQFVQNSAEKSARKQAENIDYESNYVIINGQKIENEQEAIDLTKFSFRILSENVSKTVASTEAINNFNNDY